MKHKFVAARSNVEGIRKKSFQRPNVEGIRKESFQRRMSDNTYLKIT